METSNSADRSKYRREFMIDPDAVLLNHGSYGSVSRTVFNARLKLLERIEFQPDSWFRRHSRDVWNENLKAICEFVGSKSENLVLISNATYGINSVLKSGPIPKGCSILINSWSYQAIQNACYSTANLLGYHVKKLEIKAPIKTSSDVVKKYAQFLDENKDIKLVILDHISSATAVQFPVEEILRVCREREVLLLIDGAHAPGQIPLNLDRLDVDFYIGNLHKWMYVPRGCAILWVNPKHHNIIKPVVTSHCYEGCSIQDQFFTQGTVDNSAQFCVIDALSFYKELGGFDKITEYMKHILDQGVNLLVNWWKTKILDVPTDMQPTAMRLVLMPEIKNIPIPEKPLEFYDDDEMVARLFEDFNIHLAVLIVHGLRYVRVLVNIYTEIQDFIKLADAVDKLRIV